MIKVVIAKCLAGSAVLRWCIGNLFPMREIESRVSGVGLHLRVALIGVLCALAASQTSAGGTHGKKVIEYGNDVRNTASVRQHVREFEKLPFDGLVIAVSGKNGEMLGWKLFSTTRLDPEDFERAIDDLKATKFKKFTDNFIQTMSSPSSTDWFDPNWSNVLYNASLFARVAKQGGCKGIMFDPENYTGRLWGYTMEDGKPRPGHTVEEYRAKARERGQEFIRAVNKEFADITILCLYGMSLPYVQIGGDMTQFDTASYMLLAAFLDGMSEAATPKTVIVDGFEFSYPYKQREEFVKARKVILEDSKKVSQNPEAFAKHVRVGFGIFPDYDVDTPWYTDPADLSKNYFTPAGFRAAANYALETSDKYVWVYSSKMHWLDGVPPKEYVDALRLARKGPGTRKD